MTKYIDDERGPQVSARLWGTPSAALGKRIRYLPDLPWHEVIGVVQDVRENGVYEAAPPTVYWPTMSASLNARPGRPNAIRGVSFIVRSDRPLTTGLLNQIQQAVWSVNPGLPASPRTMREVYDQSLARTSFTRVMLAIAASMARVLGVVGIYGVIAYVVSQRCARARQGNVDSCAPVAPTFAAAVCATWHREVFKLKGGPG